MVERKDLNIINDSVEKIQTCYVIAAKLEQYILWSSPCTREKEVCVYDSENVCESSVGNTPKWALLC